MLAALICLWGLGAAIVQELSPSHVRRAERVARSRHRGLHQPAGSLVTFDPSFSVHFVIPRCARSEILAQGWRQLTTALSLLPQPRKTKTRISCPMRPIAHGWN